MLFAVSVLEGNEQGPHYVRQLLDSIHQANPDRLPVTLHYARYRNTVGLFCRCPDQLQSLVRDDFSSLYAGSTIQQMEERALAPPSDLVVSSMFLRIDPDVLAITSMTHFDDLLNRDFVDPITSILSRIGDKEHFSRVDLTIRPASPLRCRQGRRIVDTLQRPLFRRYPDLANWFASQASHRARRRRWPATFLRNLLWPMPEASAHGALDDAAKVRGHHLFEVSLRLIVAAPVDNERQPRQQLQSLAGAFGVFSQPHRVRWEQGRVQSGLGRTPRPFLASSDELAQIWHPVTLRVGAASLAVTESRRLEPSADLASREGRPGDVVLGLTTFRQQRQPVWISENDRLRHLLAIGRTGTGKSTLISNMFVSDMQAGRGCCLIDPHGDLFEHVLRFVPEERTQDLVLFNPARRDQSLVFNLLECPDPNARVLVADAVLSSFKKVFGLDEQYAPRLISILRNSVLTLLENPATTLADIPRLLTDYVYRNRAIRNISNPLVQDYWVHRFGQWPKNERTKAVEAVLNKVDTFTTNPILQPIFGQPRSQLHLRQAMDSGKIVLVNLSKGRIGEDASNMLGSLLVTKLQLDAMSRADVPSDERRPFFTYIDEFQNFATESFATILSEARKYGLGLIMAHQYLDQIHEDTAKAVFGNIGTLIAFQVGTNDAEVLANHFSRTLGDVREGDLTGLPRYNAIVRLLVDGMPSRRFTMETLPPPRRCPVHVEIPVANQTPAVVESA